MNNWGPLTLRHRRGRSGSGFAYPREALGPPIRSKRPYLFADALLNQNQFILWLEDRDPVYRGEITPAGLAEAESDLGYGSDSSDSSEALSSTLSSPPESEEPTSPIDRESHSVERMGSPLTPARSRSRSCSPTMTDLFGPSSTAPSGRAVVTYLKRDRERARILAEETAAKKLSAKKAEAARRKSAALHSPRHSRRHRRGRVGDSSEYGVDDIQGLLNSGHDLHKLHNNLPRALVDRRDVVMAAVAPGPKGHGAWWASVVTRVNQDLGRIYRNGEFSHLGEGESLVRFGISFGVPWGVPHRIIQNVRTNDDEINYITASPAFKAVSDYQNHLYQQFAAASYAQVATKVDHLVARRIVSPPFKNSVFTTAEINFCDAPNISRKNEDAAFDTMEAVTSFGSYDHTQGGHIVFADDHGMFEMPVGTTVLFPAGTKRYTFAAVGKNEHRYLFRQFCSAGVLRWIDKGGRTDLQFAREASLEEQAAWEAMRQQRGQTSLKLFSKLRDVYIC